VRRVFNAYLVAIALALAAVLIFACQPPVVTTSLPETATSKPPTATRTPSPLPATSTPTPTFIPSPTPTATPTEAATPTPTIASTPTPTEAIFELVLTEAEVNQLLQDGLAKQSDVPVSNLYVRLQPGLIVTSGRTRVGFFTVDVEVTATVTVEDGKPIPEIVAIRAAGQPLTGFLRAQVENMLDPHLQRWLQTETNVYVEEVEILEGQLRITGRRK